MEYRIGELSRIFNISKEMICYFEKQGAIQAERKKDNNYRTYSIWDVFDFIELLQYRESDIKIKNLFAEKRINFSAWLRGNLLAYYQKTDKEIKYMAMSQKRTKEVLERLECYKLNEKNFWVRRIPRQYLFHFVTGEGDSYGEIDMKKEVSDRLFSPEIVRFIDPMVLFGEREEWWFSLSEPYMNLLDDDLLSLARVVEAQYCLCTIEDMGEIGDFSEHICDYGLEYANRRGYVRHGTVEGIIISRGVEMDRFRRRMEIRIPISYSL